YLAGEKIVFSGTGWAPKEAVTISMRVGSLNTTIQTTANNAGSFSVTTTMPDPRAALTSAKSGTGKLTANADESVEEGATFMATAIGASSSSSVDTEFTIGESDH